MGDEIEQTKLSDSQKQEIEEIMEEIMEEDRRLRVVNLVDGVAEFSLTTAKYLLMYWVIRNCVG